MGNVSTHVDAKSGDNRLAITRHETDAPLIPVAQIEHLQRIAPERVQWVFDQTEKEAEHRRRSLERTDWMVFIERMFGQLIAAGACSGALWVSYLLGVIGRQAAAVAVIGIVVALASVFLINRRK